MPHILLVDDEPAQRQSLRKILEAEDFKVTLAGSVSEVEDKYELSGFDLVITELKLPGDPGADLIPLAHPTPVVVTTHNASLRSAVDSMKAGAVDYLAKPCSRDDLLAVVRQALSDFPHSHIRQAPVAKPRGQFFEGRCPGMQRLQHHIAKIAQTDSTVLILGETGTGKELTARQVHRLSSRAEQRMVAVNCAAIPDTLIESELFGYEKGAFTGATTNRVGLIEAADGGTLFLDEIGELPLAAQARLLRFIQEGEIRRIGAISSRRVNVRLICATHRELAQLAGRNEFRQDLYYRINVLRLEIPPLRDRGDDVADMADWFANSVAQRLGKPHRPISAGAIRAINRYPWPGNVRELEHAVERGVVMAEGLSIDIDDLGLAAPPTATLTVAASTPAARSELDEEPHAQEAPTVEEELSLEDYFQRFVLEHQDSMSETELAQKLGISRKCLWERRQRFDLPRKKAGRRKQA